MDEETMMADLHVHQKRCKAAAAPSSNMWSRTPSFSDKMLKESNSKDDKKCMRMARQGVASAPASVNGSAPLPLPSMAQMAARGVGGISHTNSGRVHRKMFDSRPDESEMADRSMKVLSAITSASGHKLKKAERIEKPKPASPMMDGTAAILARKIAVHAEGDDDASEHSDWDTSSDDDMTRPKRATPEDAKREASKKKSFADVLSLQQFDGSVVPSPAAERVLGLPSTTSLDPLIADIAKRFGVSADVAKAVAFALAMLHVLLSDFSDAKSSWALAAKKSHSWIASTLAQGGVQSVSDVSKQIGSLVSQIAF